MSEDKLPSAVQAIGYGCIYIPRLFLYFLVRVPSLVLEDIRRRKLECIIEKEGYNSRDLISLEGLLKKKIDIYVSAIHNDWQGSYLQQEVKFYSPEALLTRFFAAQQAYHPNLTTGDSFSERILEYEQLVLYDAYFQILDRNGYVEQTKKRMPKLFKKPLFLDCGR